MQHVKRPTRKPSRIQGYDYAQSGSYFITLCTMERLCFFGTLNDGQMLLNEAGEVVEACWKNLPEQYPNLQLDAFILMPNHLHGVLMIQNPTTLDIKALSIISILQAFKSRTTHQYTQGVKNRGWLPFPGKLWQRSYYEHIIRNETDLNRIREYISNNPINWALDENNPFL